MNRLFLALDPSSIVRRSLAEWQDKPKDRLDRQGMRWVKPEKYHVTLLFLGDLPVDLVTEQAQESVKTLPAPHLALGRIMGLPDNKRPSIIALSVVDTTQMLIDLEAELRKALLGEVEAEYTPHLTLSRMKPASTKLGHKLRDYIHSGDHPEPLIWTPEGVTLYNSLPDGSYERLNLFPFK